MRSSLVLAAVAHLLAAALSAFSLSRSPEEAPKEDANWEASWSEGGSGAAGAEDDGGGEAHVLQGLELGAPPTSEPVYRLRLTCHSTE